ncbi:hypothetical protein MKW92_003362 [Papaver armeniacum]|nr:hypothetical protein MKW92_003362 [Papaver armeniacum]
MKNDRRKIVVPIRMGDYVPLDCGLHVCYYMKSLLKGNMKSHEENISEKVESMRAKLCYKILVDKTLKEI